MELYLKIDEQTLSDLAIFGRSGKPSIFDLYNKTTTQGGAQKLRALFSHPMANHEEINTQSEIFRYFSSAGFSFPVDAANVSALTYYMENHDVRSQLQVKSKSVSEKFKEIVATEAEQIFVKQGVDAALSLFFKIQSLITKMDFEVQHTVYASKFNTLKDLIMADEFALVRRYSYDKTKISQDTLAVLDKALRFEHRKLTLELLDMLYELDVYVSVGQLARIRKFCFASALPKSVKTLFYKQVYHPNVAHAIANDLKMDPKHNVLFLTGANMAGKSTFMKTIGIALYLGHMGFPIPAENFEFAVRDGIYTSINLPDNLTQGASHYYAEVLRVKEVAVALSEGRALFVIFDELFRGTNVKDAYDATIALTTAFSSKSSSQFVISTHIMEAGEILQKKKLPIKYQYLPTEMVGNTPSYPRVLKDGITEDRQGMLIIKNEGVLDILDNGLKQMGT